MFKQVARTYIHTHALLAINTLASVSKESVYNIAFLSVLNENQSH